jgi:hypothetical protein
VTAEDIDPNIAGYLEDTVFDHPVDPGTHRIFGNGQFTGNQLIGFAAVFQVADDLDIDWSICMPEFSGGGGVFINIMIAFEKVKIIY